MEKIKVIDARMGRGKTSAAIRYMEENKETKRFLYITPYLKEMDRICDKCDFDVQKPEYPNNNGPKLKKLKQLLRTGKNVVTTHALFLLLDEEALDIIRDKNYCLIVDEELQVVDDIWYSKEDLEIAINAGLVRRDGDRVVWVKDDYSGNVFAELREMVRTKEVLFDGTRVATVMNPALLEAFSEVTLMTYMFKWQYQRAYLDLHGFQYEICGIDDSDGYRFSDEPDAPPKIDYGSLITIVEDDVLNSVGNEKPSALSKSWYSNAKNASKIKTLKKNMDSFMRRKNGPKGMMWTCFADYQEKLYGERNRYKKKWLALNARATNDFHKSGRLAYMVNRYCVPPVIDFFNGHNLGINEDKLVLSEMLQWIWRSRIRDNKEIVVYIPSKRMRNLLKGWIEDVSKGGDAE